MLVPSSVDGSMSRDPGNYVRWMLRLGLAIHRLPFSSLEDNILLEEVAFLWAQLKSSFFESRED